MVDETQVSERTGGRGLLRSIAHRQAGVPTLPFEGRLAPFDGAVAWLNSDPLTLEGLRGRVVLVDFWTFTCVNWLRTFPYVRAWAEKYADDGLTVIGVHTPEFGFEGDLDNVVAQTRALGVEYPVAVDSTYAVWRAYANHFWPAVYIADDHGRIRYHHFGESEYAMTEMVIQQLLAEAGADDVDQELAAVEPRGLEVAADWATLRSPESYLGYGQAVGFASAREARLDRPHHYEASPRLRLNTWDLTGGWTVAEHAAVLDEPGGRVAFQFQGRDVNLVMGPAPGRGPVRFRVLLDGETALTNTGTDVDRDGTGTAADQRCYQLIRQHGRIGERRFEIEFLDAGVEVYCFTFG